MTATSAAGRAAAWRRRSGQPPTMRLRRRFLPSFAVAVVAAAGLGACGGEDETTLDVRPSGPTAYISEAEAQGLLESRLKVQYAGPRRSDALSSDLDPQPAVGLRISITPSGEKFDLLVFATSQAARAAEPGIRDSAVVGDGGAFRRAANLVAVFPEQPARVDGYRVVADLFDTLERACARPGSPEFGELCYGTTDVRLPSTESRPDGDDEIGPAGEGTDPDTLLEPGSTVRLGGLAYTPVLSRQLNPKLRPDRSVLEGVDVDQAGGPLEVGVFLRVCNEDGSPRTSTDRFVLKDAFGTRIAPVEPAADNALAYRPRRLAEGECLPEEASAAEKAFGGRALVFLVALKIRRNFPLGLEITAKSGERRTIEVGL